MNNVVLAQSAYGAPQAPVRSARSVEYQAFAKVTSELVRHHEEPGDKTSRIAALHDNRRLWDILSADVIPDSNGLPVELRAGIYNLAQFVARHSAEVVRNDASIEPLIDINKTVMRGLRSLSGDG